MACNPFHEQTDLPSTFWSTAQSHAMGCPRLPPSIGKVDSPSKSTAELMHGASMKVYVRYEGPWKVPWAATTSIFAEMSTPDHGAARKRKRWFNLSSHTALLAIRVAVDRWPSGIFRHHLEVERIGTCFKGVKQLIQNGSAETSDDFKWLDDDDYDP